MPGMLRDDASRWHSGMQHEQLRCGHLLEDHCLAHCCEQQCRLCHVRAPSHRPGLGSSLPPKLKATFEPFKLVHEPSHALCKRCKLLIYQMYLVQVGKVLWATVQRMTNFGAFLRPEGGEVDGLLHISAISKTRVENVDVRAWPACTALPKPAYGAVALMTLRQVQSHCSGSGARCHNGFGGCTMCCSLRRGCMLCWLAKGPNPRSEGLQEPPIPGSRSSRAHGLTHAGGGCRMCSRSESVCCHWWRAWKATCAPITLKAESCAPEPGCWADVCLRLQDVFQVGERVRVLVAGMEDDMRRISFSTALLEVNPGDMLHNKVSFVLQALLSKCLSWWDVLISFSTALLEVNPGDMLHNKVCLTKALCSICLSWRGVCKCCTHPYFGG